MRTQALIEETSLEEMAIVTEARQVAEEWTEQDEFDELVRELADIHAEAPVEDEFVSEDEFTCRRCHLVLHRSLFRDADRLVCNQCAARV